MSLLLRRAEARARCCNGYALEQSLPWVQLGASHSGESIMKSVPFKAILAASLGVLAALPSPALAWGKEGHRVVAAIADNYLGPKARGEVRRIFGVESMAEASTWPDFMRADPDEFWQKTASPWHYVTVEGTAYSTSPAAGDAVTALKRFVKIVRDEKAPLKDRQLALRFIIHIVGDLHQPFHAGNGTDRGGNDVKVTWFGKPTNLHAVWDTEMVDDEGLSYTEFAKLLENRVTPEQQIAWTSADPLAWIARDVSVRAGLYPADPAIGSSYVYAQKPLLEEQLERGGLDLAAYLNWVFS